MPLTTATAALIGSAVAGASSIAGSAINSASYAGLNRQNRKFTREMYQRQLDDQINLWNMQNEYNTPEAQRQRYEEAGINANVAMGQGTANTAGALNAPTPMNASTSAPRFGDAFNGLSDAVSQYFNIKNQISQSRLLESRANQADALAGYTQEEIQRVKFENTQNAVKAQINELTAQGLLKRNEGQEIDNQFKKIDLAFEANINQSRLDRLTEEINLMRQDGKLKDDSHKLNVQQLSLNVVQMAYLEAKARESTISSNILKQDYNSFKYTGLTREDTSLFNNYTAMWPEQIKAYAAKIAEERKLSGSKLADFIKGVGASIGALGIAGAGLWYKYGPTIKSGASIGFKSIMPPIFASPQMMQLQQDMYSPINTTSNPYQLY